MINVLSALKKHKFLFIIPVIGVWLSCGTLKPNYSSNLWLGTLPEGNYGQVNVPGQLTKWSALGGINLNIPEIQSLLDSTEKIYGSFITDERTIEAYTIVLVGRYPYFKLNMGLNFYKEFKRTDSPYIIFKHRERNLYLSCPNNFLIILSSIDPTNYIKNYRSSPGLTIIEEAEKATNDGAFIYFPLFDANVIPEKISFNIKKLPIAESWFGMNQNQNTYTFQGGFHLDTEKQARLFFKTFKAFTLLLMGEMDVSGVADRLRKSDFNQDDTFIFFEGLEFTGKELKKGFLLFKTEQ